MSEMTIVQLMAAQWERALRKQRQPGHGEWQALPFVCMFMVCITAAILEPFRQRAA